MKQSYKTEISAGILVSVNLMMITIVFILIFNNIDILFIYLSILPISFGFGKQIVMAVYRPNTAMGILTGHVGVSFAYVAIDLCRQDKKFSKEELDKLCNYFVKEFGKDLEPTVRAFVKKNMKAQVDLFSHMEKVKKLSHRKRLLFLYHLFSIAAADRFYHEAEDVYLRKVARYIDVDNEHFDDIKSRFIKTKKQESHFEQNQKEEKKEEQNKSHSQKKSSSKDFFSPLMASYLVLEVKQTATNEEIKKAYRRLAKKHHPDKLATQGEVYQKIAASRFREIKKAYDKIKKARKMK